MKASVQKRKKKKKLLGPNQTAVNSWELIAHSQDSFLWCSCFTPTVSWAGTLLFKNACFPHWVSVSGRSYLCLFFFLLSWLMDVQYIYGSHSSKSSPSFIPEVMGHPQQISSNKFPLTHKLLHWSKGRHNMNQVPHRTLPLHSAPQQLVRISVLDHLLPLVIQTLQTNQKNISCVILFFRNYIREKRMSS